MRILFPAPLVILAVLAGCVPRAAPPTPAPPRPIPTRPAPPPVTPPAPEVDWRDGPIAPGTWRYLRTPNGSTATFGRDERNWTLRLTCRRGDRSMLIEKVGHGGTALTIRTTTLTRTLPARSTVHADGWPPATIDAVAPASDPLLDAMGFSRGRFLIEGGVTGAVAVPAWAEVLRVTEDCRD